MKRLLGMALLLGLAFVARADKPGAYEKLECRDDDPYVFCTQGCKDRDKNWIPIAPMAGLWTAVPGYCPWPQSKGECCVGNVCFALWTQKAERAVYQYTRICHRAHTGSKRDWKSDDGQGEPEDTDVSH